MRHEGLDPEGKVGLAGMLMQIGFKDEAVAEYLMAADIYAERGNSERAAKLYERVLDIDKNNAQAKRGLAKLLPPSQEYINDMVAKMGFGSAPADQETKEATPTKQVPAEEVMPPAAVIEEKLEVYRDSEPAGIAPVEEPTVVTQPTGEDESVTEEDGINLSVIGIEEFLASLAPLLGNTPEELKQRRELAVFFRDEGLWSEAFFEAKAAYIKDPSVEKLHEMLSLLAHSGDKETLIGFLVTESFACRESAVERAVLEALITVYEDEGRLEDAEKLRERLSRLGENQSESKKQGVKIIKDIPKLSDDEEDPPSDKKKHTDPIQFL